MPEVPPPEECELEEVRLKRRVATGDLPPNVRDMFLAYAQVKSPSPCKSAIKLTFSAGKGEWAHRSQED